MKTVLSLGLKTVPNLSNRSHLEFICVILHQLTTPYREIRACVSP